MATWMVDEPGKSVVVVGETVAVVHSFNDHRRSSTIQLPLEAARQMRKGLKKRRWMRQLHFMYYTSLNPRLGRLERGAPSSSRQRLSMR